VSHAPDQRLSVPTTPSDAPEAVLRILLEVTTALTSLLDIDQVLGEMLTRSVLLAKSTAGTLILVDTNGQAVRKIAARGGMPYQVDERTLNRVLEQGLARWVFDHGVPARIDETLEDPRWLRIDNNGQNSRSAVCLPVWRRKRILGILTLTHSCPRHFNDDILKLLEAIAGQAGIAIENAQLFGEVQRLATTDALTGIANRRHFLDRAETAFATDGSHIAVLMIDVDHFKSINDTRGHLAGDDALVDISRRLQACVPPDRGVVGRYGGEEFAVVLYATQLSEALAVAQRIREQVRSQAFETRNGPLRVTVSVGVAMAGESRSLSEVLTRADDRLYEAKHAGRDQVRA
jgi:diguanylate cyclase (GGDEF)-like protein